MNNFGSQVTDVNGQVVGQQQMQAQVVNQAPVQQPVLNNQQVQNNQALFTQEQLNSIISGRINPLNQKINELNTQLAQQHQLSQSYLNELNGFKQRDLASKAGVPAQFVDFAVFEANKLAVNGKSFEDAIKEYVSSNGQLFGVSQSDGQTNPNTTPVVGQVTQGFANPAQTNQVQQFTQGVDGNQVLQNNQQVLLQNSQQSVQQNILPNNQSNIQGQINNVATNVVPNNIQYGSTSISNAGSPSGVNNIDSQVDEFLKANGLKK